MLLPAMFLDRIRSTKSGQMPSTRSGTEGPTDDRIEGDSAEGITVHPVDVYFLKG
jgi:hypothetical protein